MARIRSIHPGLFTDEAFVSCSPLARLLALGLWTESDDHGVFEWKPVTMKMRLLGADATAVEPLLTELMANNLVAKEEWGGKIYGLVRNFCIYQRPKAPTYRFELPRSFRTYVGLNKDGTRPNAHASPTNAPNIPNRFPIPTETHAQMEDGEESSRREEESNHIDKPVVVVVTREPEKPASTTTTTKAIDEVLVKANPLGTALPDDWTPNDHDQAVAASFGMAGAVVEEQLLEFHAYNASRGTFSPDWSATWFRWCSAWKVKQPKEAPRVQLSTGYVPTEADWNSAAKTWAKQQRWSRHLGNEPGMGGCKCPPAILTAHGIDPATGMVKAVAQ